MYMKVHMAKNNRIVAVCDAELLGKILEEGEITLDLRKHESFYKGEKTTSSKVQEALKSFNSANLVGKKAVDTAVSMGIVEADAVSYIKQYPYIQLYKI